MDRPQSVLVTGTVVIVTEAALVSDSMAASVELKLRRSETVSKIKKGAQQLIGLFLEDVGGLLWNRNVNRRCFYSNSSLGGSLSRLILSMIKALLGERMKRSGGRPGSRQRWAKMGRGQGGR